MTRTDATPNTTARHGAETDATRGDLERPDLRDNPQIQGAGGEPTAPVATADPLERQFRQILVELEMLSHGSTQGWDKSAKGENENPRPFGEGRPVHEMFREDWLEAKTQEDAENVLNEAREALEAWQGRNRSQEAQEWDETAWILKDGEGFEAVEVARRFNTTPSRVRKLRTDANRDGEFGKPFEEPKAIDKTERVLYLLDKQMSVRAVAAQVGLHSTQVQRIKARRAA